MDLLISSKKSCIDGTLTWLCCQMKTEKTKQSEEMSTNIIEKHSILNGYLLNKNVEKKFHFL